MIANAILAGLLKHADIRPDVKLLEHQERVRKKINKEPGLLLYHGLGSGKTLSSIAIAESLGGKASVVVPAALRENYRKELANYVHKPRAKYDIKSYEQASKKLDPSDVVIFDEAHRLGRTDSSRSRLAKQVSGKAVLLTGTPIRNEPSEALPLLQAIAKDRPIPRNAVEFDKQFVGTRKINPGFFARLRGVKPGEERFIRNKSGLASLVRGRVDYQESKGEFPEVSHSVKEVQMSPDQTGIYEGLLNVNPSLAYKVRANLPPSKKESQQLNAFLSGIRQVSNDPLTYNQKIQGRPNERSPKIRAMFSSLTHKLADPEHKALVYSNYLQAGVMPLAEELRAAGVPHAVFHGGISDKQRKQIVQDYNDGKIKVLLISGAGAEGLDLKGTRSVQVMEPHWNSARIRQVVGRAVRNRSHAHLPAGQRHVEVEHYVVKPQPKSRVFGLLPPKYEQGADAYMMSLARNKQKLVDDVLSVFKEEGQRHEGI